MVGLLLSLVLHRFGNGCGCGKFKLNSARSMSPRFHKLREMPQSLFVFMLYSFTCTELVRVHMNVAKKANQDRRSND